MIVFCVISMSVLHFSFQSLQIHGRQQLAEGSLAPWIFIDGTDFVDNRGLIVLFFGLFLLFRSYFYISKIYI